MGLTPPKMHQYAKCKNTPIIFTILSDLILENIISICCFVKTIVVCWFFSGKDWYVLLAGFDFIEVEPLFCCLTFDMLICGPFKAVLKLFCINEDEDCFGGSGAKGNISLGNYW